MTRPIGRRLSMWQHDEATARRAQDLVTPHKWRVLARNDAWIWGHIATADTFTYNTAVHTEQNVAQCDCPVRKTPCKHQLGLLLLFESQPDRFIVSELPPWIKKPKIPRDGSTDKPNPTGTEAWVNQERLVAMQEGAQLLTQWLEDQLRIGLAPILDNPRPLQMLATRLADAKLGGLSARIAAFLINRTDLPDPLQTLGQLFAYLNTIAAAIQKYDQWPQEVQIPLLRACGVQMPKVKVRQVADTITDVWCTVSVTTMPAADNPGLTVQKTYLWGANTGSWALDTQFYLTNSGPETVFELNAVYAGTVYYYPSAVPLLALTDLTPCGYEAGYHWQNLRPTAFDEVKATHRRALQQLPWVEIPPVWVEGAVVHQNTIWWLVNQQRQAIQIDDTAVNHHLLLEAATAGFAVFAIIPTGHKVRLLAFIAWGELSEF